MGGLGIQLDAFLAVGPTGHILFCGNPAWAELWSPDGGRWIRLDNESLWGYGRVAGFAANGRELLVVDRERVLQAIALDDGPSLRETAAFSAALKARGAAIRDFVLHPDGVGIAAMVHTAEGNRVAIGDLREGRVRLGPVVPVAKTPAIDASGERLIFVVYDRDGGWHIAGQDWHDPEGRVHTLARGGTGDSPDELLAHPIDPNEVAIRRHDYASRVDLNPAHPPSERFQEKARLEGRWLCMAYDPRNGTLIAENHSGRHLVHPGGHRLLRPVDREKKPLGIAFHPRRVVRHDPSRGDSGHLGRRDPRARIVPSAGGGPGVIGATRAPHIPGFRGSDARSAQPRQPGGDNRRMGAGLLGKNLEFLGQQSVPVGAVAAQRDAWRAQKTGPATRLSDDDRYVGPSASSPVRVVTQWLRGMRAARGAVVERPPGHRLPAFGGDERLLPTALGVRADGTIVCQRGGQWQHCTPPYYAWKAGAGPEQIVARGSSALGRTDAQGQEAEVLSSFMENLRRSRGGLLGGVAQHPDGNAVAALIRTDGAWRLLRGDLSADRAEFAPRVPALSKNYQLEFHPSGRWLVLSRNDEVLKVLAWPAGDRYHDLSDSAAGRARHYVAMHPSMDQVAVMRDDGKGGRYELTPNGPAAIESLHVPHGGPIAFDPNGGDLVGLSRSGGRHVWSSSAAGVRRDVPRTGRGASGEFAIAFSPDGDWYVTGTADDRVLVWDATTHEPWTG